MADSSNGTSTSVTVVKNRGQWQPGKPAHPGRAPNTAARIGPRRLLAKIQDHLHRKAVKNGKDYDPVVALAEIANDLSHPIEVRVVAHSKVARYVHAEVRPVEATHNDDQGVIEAKVTILDAIVEAVQSKK